MGGAVSGTRSTSTAWSLPRGGLFGERQAGYNKYTSSTPLNRNYTTSTSQSRNYTSSTPQANHVPSTPSRGKSCNFTTSTPIRQDSDTPEAPQWSPHPSQALCGARGDGWQTREAPERQKPSAASLSDSMMGQMQGSAQGGFVTPSRPHGMANKSHSVQVI